MELEVTLRFSSMVVEKMEEIVKWDVCSQWSSSILPHADLEPNDHRDYTLHFTKLYTFE